MYASAPAVEDIDPPYFDVYRGPRLRNGSDLIVVNVLTSDMDCMQGDELPYTVELERGDGYNRLYFQDPPCEESITFDELRELRYVLPGDRRVDHDAMVANLPCGPTSGYSIPAPPAREEEEDEPDGPVDARVIGSWPAEWTVCAADAAGKRLAWEDFPIEETYPDGRHRRTITAHTWLIRAEAESFFGFVFPTEQHFKTWKREYGEIRTRVVKTKRGIEVRFKWPGFDVPIIAARLGMIIGEGGSFIMEGSVGTEVLDDSPEAECPEKCLAELRAKVVANDTEAGPVLSQKGFIQITNELHQNIDDGCAALGNEENLYQRGGRLVRVVYQAVKESDRKAGSGAPAIQELRAQTLKPILTSVADWSRKSKKTDKATGVETWKDVAAMPTEDIVAGVLHKGEWPEVRVLAAISETPILRPDGSIVQTPGYDRQTSYIYKPTQPFPTVPDAPTRGDATAALPQLRDVFDEFSYVDKAAGYVPVAAILSIIARAAIGAVPLFVFDAAVRGSGKSLQTDVISLIATGRPVAKANWSSNEEEIKKILQTFAAEGVALFSWDNVPAGEPFGNSHLDAALTNEGTMQFRMLGRIESKTAPWTAVQMASGNNFSFRGDTARRSIPCRLEPTVENPETREGFRHPNLRAWVKENRAALVVAALTVLRAYFVAGMPEPVQTIGSFEKWAALIPSAIRWAGGADVTTCRATNEVEPEKDMLRELHDAWPVGEKFTAKTLFAKSREGTGPAVDRFPEALRDVFDGAETAMAAGTKLRAHAERIIGNRRLTGKEKDRTGAALWTVK